MPAHKLQPVLRTPSIGLHFLSMFFHSVHLFHTMDKNPMGQDFPPSPVPVHISAGFLPPASASARSRGFLLPSRKS